MTILLYWVWMLVLLALPVGRDLRAGPAAGLTAGRLFAAARHRAQMGARHASRLKAPCGSRLLLSLCLADLAPNLTGRRKARRRAST